MRCSGGVYVDVGSNVGTQVHKLYQPHICYRAPVQSLFRVFPSRSSVCTLGIEPNPNHAQHLRKVSQGYAARGIYVTFLAALASNVDGQALFYHNKDYINGKRHNEWTGGAIKRHGNQAGVVVRTVDLARLVKAWWANPIVLKIDVEGNETTLLPWLLEKDVLCNITGVYVDLHGSHSRQVFSQVQSSLKSMSCPVKLLTLDDETPCNLPFPNGSGALILPPCRTSTCAKARIAEARAREAQMPNEKALPPINNHTTRSRPAHLTPLV